jgi:glycosyltransferase involved in cell wall biosynthesis
MASIGINALALAAGRTGGAETYIRKLIGCPAFKEALAEHDISIFTGTPCRSGSGTKRLSDCKLPGQSDDRNRRIIWEQLHLPQILHKHKLDLVHFPYSSSCFRYSKPSVITVHDTTNFIMPESVCLTEKIYRKILQTASARNPVCHMLAVSETDRATLERHLTLPAGRTSVVYHGAPEEFKAPAETIGNPRPEGPLLWIGRAYYHKNVELLIRMMAELKTMLGPATPQMKLIGLDDASISRLGALARQLEVSALITLAGPVGYAELPAIMRQARMLVFSFFVRKFRTSATGGNVQRNSRAVLGLADLEGDSGRCGALCRSARSTRICASMC